MANLPQIYICSEDASSIGRMMLELACADALTDDARLALSEKLFEAYIVSQRALPYGTVRLNSRVTYDELPSGMRRTFAIVAPRAADTAAGRISVLSPIGRALLGHRIGSVVDVPLHAGPKLLAQIVAVEAGVPRSDPAALASA
jgi:transcription elongation GreA/GreB family factor